MLSSRRIFFPYSRSWFTRIPSRAGPVIAIPKFWLNWLSRIPFSFLIPYPCPNFGDSCFPGPGGTQIPYPVVVSLIPYFIFSSSLRSKRFCAVQDQRTRNKSQRPREKWGLFCSGTKRKRLLRRLILILQILFQTLFTWFNPRSQRVACDARTPAYSRKYSGSDYNV